MRKRTAAVCIFFLVVTLTSCKSKTEIAEEHRKGTEREKDQKVISFAATHNAIADWKAALPDQSVIGSYSIQLENALVRPDKKAVAMRAYLEDIVRRDNRMFLEFSDWEDLYLTLEASPEIVEQVLKEHPSKFFAEYAIIAEVQSVQKPTLQVAAETTGDGPEVEIQAADKLHVRGRCVVLLNLEGAKK